MIDAAEQSRRPEYARAILVAATTGLRRAELCGLRRWRDLDLERGLMRVSTSVVLLPGRPLGEIPTKNRRVRMLAVDDLTASVLRAQIQMVEERARAAGVELVADPYVFTDAADGSEPWKPDAVSRYFARLRARIGSGASRLPLPPQVHGDLRPGDGLLGGSGSDARRPRSDGRGEALQRQSGRDRPSVGEGGGVASHADRRLATPALARAPPAEPHWSRRRELRHCASFSEVSRTSVQVPQGSTPHHHPEVADRLEQRPAFPRPARQCVPTLVQANLHDRRINQRPVLSQIVSTSSSRITTPSELIIPSWSASSGESLVARYPFPADSVRRTAGKAYDISLPVQFLPACLQPFNVSDRSLLSYTSQYLSATTT